MRYVLLILLATVFASCQCGFFAAGAYGFNMSTADYYQEEEYEDYDEDDYMDARFSKSTLRFVE